MTVMPSTQQLVKASSSRSPGALGSYRAVSELGRPQWASHGGEPGGPQLRGTPGGPPFWSLSSESPWAGAEGMAFHRGPFPFHMLIFNPEAQGDSHWLQFHCDRSPFWPQPRWPRLCWSQNLLSTFF